jgi:hypothetical protein
LVTQFSDRQAYHRNGDTNVLRIEKDLAVKPRA